MSKISAKLVENLIKTYNTHRGMKMSLPPLKGDKPVPVVVSEEGIHAIMAELKRRALGQSFELPDKESVTKTEWNKQLGSFTELKKQLRLYKSLGITGLPEFQRKSRTSSITCNEIDVDSFMEDFDLDAE